VATAEASLAGLEIEHEVGFDALPHGTAYLSALSQLAHELWPGVLTYSRWEPAGLTDPARAVALAPNDLPGLLRTTALAGPPPRILAEAMVSTWEEAEAVFSAAAAAGCRIAAVRLAPLPVPAPAARWDTAAVTSALEHLPENSWQPEPLARLALSPHQTCVYRWRLELPPGAEVALEFGPDTDSWIFVAPLVVPPSGGRSESERDGKGRKGTEGDGGDRNPQSEMGVGPGVRSLRSAIRNSQFAIRNRGRSLRAEDHDCYARLKDLPTACELLVVCAARPRRATWPLVRPGLRRVALQPGRRRPEFELRRWRVRRVDAGIGDEAPEVRPDFEDSGWEEIEAGQTFQALFADYDGWAWYRTRLQIRAEDLAAGYTHLCFEGIDDDALIYVNGVRVGGKKGWDVPYSCDAAGALHPGENVLVLAIYDLARPGGIYQPAYLSWAPWGGHLLTEAEVARLDGESPHPLSLISHPSSLIPSWIRTCVE
jgi:hypothetical protein